MNSQLTHLPHLSPLPSFQIWGLTFPTYFFVNSLATCLCICWLFYRSKTKGLSQTHALDSCFYILGAGFVGSRLAHILIEEPLYYWENFSRIFQFWRGGFVFFGGLLFGYIAGALYFGKKKDGNWLQWHDTFAPIIGGGYAIGRLGCFLEGCCYGKVCDLPWATPVSYLQEGGHIIEVFQHPTQLYAVAWEGLLILGLLAWERKKPLKPGTLFFTWLGLHGAGRILMEIYRGDPRGPQWLNLSVSMAFSLLLIALSGLFLVRAGDKLRNRPQKP